MPSASASRLLAILLLGASWIHADAKNEAGELELLVSDDGSHFQYSISHPEEGRQAWIEVLDVPTVLDSRPIAIQQNGEFDWAWNHKMLNDYESEDDILTLALWDPDGETLVCEGTVISAHPGGEVSQITLGGRTKFSPEPRLGTSLVRVEERSPSLTVLIYRVRVLEADVRRTSPQSSLWTLRHKG